MTAQKVSRPSGRAQRRALDEAYWSTLAQTADLVRKLTSLADRYDRAVQDGDPRTAERKAATVLMRATAESGRQLIRSLAPPAVPDQERQLPSALERADAARSRDVRARGRDAAAQARDERADERDARVRALAGDADAGFAGRFLAARDRDDAAGDRAASQEDRRAAARDRHRAQAALDLDAQARTLITTLEQRAVVRQAQGVLMERGGMSAGEALAALVLATTGHLTLDGVAAHVVQHAALPLEQEVR